MNILAVCFVECVHEQGKKVEGHRKTREKKVMKYYSLFYFAHGKKFLNKRKRNFANFLFAPKESLRNFLLS